MRLGNFARGVNKCRGMALLITRVIFLLLNAVSVHLFYVFSDVSDIFKVAGFEKRFGFVGMLSFTSSAADSLVERRASK